jgi:hypothetical protein
MLCYCFLEQFRSLDVLNFADMLVHTKRHFETLIHSIWQKRNIGRSPFFGLLKFQSKLAPLKASSVKPGMPHG